ncbi:hypothetical protein HID58_093804, partial [Brassica napus]
MWTSHKFLGTSSFFSPSSEYLFVSQEKQKQRNLNGASSKFDSNTFPVSFKFPRSDIPCVATAGKRLRRVPSKNSRKSKKMKTTPGYSSRLVPMTILDGMESETLATLAPVTKTIQAENVKFDGAQSVGDRNNQGEILETNRESPAKERQKKKRSVEKRQNKLSENGLREP